MDQQLMQLYKYVAEGWEFVKIPLWQRLRSKLTNRYKFKMMSPLTGDDPDNKYRYAITLRLEPEPRVARSALMVCEADGTPRKIQISWCVKKAV